MNLFLKKSDLLQGRVSGESFLRGVGLIAVFVLVGWLFWKNSQANLEKIMAQSTLLDAGKILDADQRTAVREFGRRLKDDFGFELKVVVASPFSAPQLDVKTLYIGIDPNAAQATVLLPPLAARALGPEFTATLGAAHFAPYFERGDWPAGLLRLMDRVWFGLKDASSPTPRSAP